jgi:uncharacterized protein with HEPN domain
VRDEHTHLLHAIAAIDAIQRYTVDGREAFLADGKTQDAVIRNIEIIGQGVKGISDDTRALGPDVPWWQIARMRDKLIHEYLALTSCSYGTWSSTSYRPCDRSWKG